VKKLTRDRIVKEINHSRNSWLVSRNDGLQINTKVAESEVWGCGRIPKILGYKNLLGCLLSKELAEIMDTYTSFLKERQQSLLKDWNL